MKKLFLVFAIALGGLLQTNAQSYSTAIGGRLGPSYGFTVKHFFKEKIAIEGLVTTRYYGGLKRIARGNPYGFGNGMPGINLTALFEWHFPIGSIDGFKWFIGGGAHIGVWGGSLYHPWYPDDRAYFQTGIDVVGGVEYTFSKIPLTLQADLKPSINFFEWTGVWYDEFAVSARYTF